MGDRMQNFVTKLGVRLRTQQIIAHFHYRNHTSDFADIIVVSRDSRKMFLIPGDIFILTHLLKFLKRFALHITRCEPPPLEPLELKRLRQDSSCERESDILAQDGFFTQVPLNY
ncbi:hypothetical protein DMENIID0001_078720 [Sergentomyia squamirostris]